MGNMPELANQHHTNARRHGDARSNFLSRVLPKGPGNKGFKRMRVKRYGKERPRQKKKVGGYFPLRMDRRISSTTERGKKFGARGDLGLRSEGTPIHETHQKNAPLRMNNKVNHSGFNRPGARKGADMGTFPRSAAVNHSYLRKWNKSCSLDKRQRCRGERPGFANRKNHHQITAVTNP